MQDYILEKKVKPKETKVADTILVSTPILNGLYTQYEKVA